MYQIQTTVKDHGLSVKDVPFAEGEAVLIMVESISKDSDKQKLSHDEYVNLARSLRGSAPGLDSTVEREDDRV